MPRNLPRLVKLLASGATLETAGAKIGISKTTAQRWIARYGTDARRRIKPRLTCETSRRIRELRREGKTLRQIADDLGVSPGSVHSHAARPTARRCSKCRQRYSGENCLLCEARSYRQNALAATA
ncbi:helix-turn-helix domain-containing protein [Aureliella helgolandensis]|uniref:helix-turn-helix domain-containing protein n=1 Tax=Aureliella helgolandensis TaxID=2527968 RepID=UPI0018D12428